MVVVLERLVQKVKPDKWAALDEIDKKFNDIESKIGFPPKRRYRSLIGPLDNDTIVIEREWKSMAEMENAVLGSMGNAELQKLSVQLNDIIEKSWHEVYAVWPFKV
ncbi:MAG: hypothetical protein JW839_09925 [Candidatus Lokiarchaeota archaeon]|nr:hypothetical protein [Candidatus Lokiarchaeota archaeon]